MTWTLAWALTIVFLPFPTELAVDTPGTHVSVRALYIGTMALSSVCLAALAILISRRPALRTAASAEQSTSSERSVAAADPGAFDADVAIISAIVFVVAFVVAISVRPIGYFALLLLIPTGQFVKLWRRFHPPTTRAT